MSGDPSDLLTVQEVAGVLRASDETVRRMLRSGVLKGMRHQINGSSPWRVRRVDLDRYINEQSYQSKR